MEAAAEGTLDGVGLEPLVEAAADGTLEGVAVLVEVLETTLLASRSTSIESLAR